MRIAIFGVSSPYAWDVLESARGAGYDPYCIDNHGSADVRLPLETGFTAETDRYPMFVLGLSSAEHRAAAAKASVAAGYLRPISLSDPSARVASTSKLGHGVYLNAGVVVASNTVIGCHANINRSASIGHDNHIGFAASIAPGAVLTGGITVRAVASIGAGAVILPNLTIGHRAVVGAGAVVTRDVEDYEIVVGNPARVLRVLSPIEDEDKCPHC